MQTTTFTFPSLLTSLSKNFFKLFFNDLSGLFTRWSLAERGRPLAVRLRVGRREWASAARESLEDTARGLGVNSVSWEGDESDWRTSLNGVEVAVEQIAEMD